MKLSQFLNRIVFVYRRGRSCYFKGKGRDEETYIEGDRRLHVCHEFWTEGLFGKSATRISVRGIEQHWEPPYEHEALTTEKRLEVLRALCAYYDLIGEPYTVEDI